MDSVCVFWFRRDLRLDDNAGLYHALKGGVPVLPLFIFDTNILDELEDKEDRRVEFIVQALAAMNRELHTHHSSLYIYHGTPTDCFKHLLGKYNIQAVYTNHDYEPYARQRDEDIQQLLQANNIGFHSFKDQVIFEKSEVMKDDGLPYNVFTPYSRKWKERLTEFYLKSYPTQKYFGGFYKDAQHPFLSLDEIGFKPSGLESPAGELKEEIAEHYKDTREYPGINGTTRLGVHLRFGTISIRKLAAKAGKLSETLLNELIWREFYMMILWHYPHVVFRSFKPEYDHIQWRNNEAEFRAWCEGNTGIPIVDAGMRELNATGYMHNRVRMIVASFLTKNLLTDWRWGEAYFAKKLLDYDLSANNGGWQWCAGTGCDAAPYFRVFNPLLQTQKFDPELAYVKKWVPEYDQLTYAQPVVDLAASRDRCLKEYKRALQQK